MEQVEQMFAEIWEHIITEQKQNKPKVVVETPFILEWTYHYDTFFGYILSIHFYKDQNDKNDHMATRKVWGRSIKKGQKKLTPSDWKRLQKTVLSYLNNYLKEIEK